MVSERDMTGEEAIEDIAFSLANEICDGTYDARQTRIRELLIEFAEEVKRQSMEP